MRQVEIQAFSVEEAVRLALEQLGRTRDQVKVEVLATDPGSEEVLVRVSVRDVAGPGGHGADEEASPKRPRRPMTSTPTSGPMLLGRDHTRDRERGRGPGGTMDRGRGDRPGRYDRPQGGQGWERPVARGRRGPAGPVDEETFEDDQRGNLLEPGEVELDSSVLSAGQTPGEAASPEDAVAPIAAEVLQKVLSSMHVRGRIGRRDVADEGEAAFEEDQSAVTLNVTGLNERDQNLLIGRRGETLDALQFLVNLIVGRQVDLWTRVIIDIEGYRLRRKFALITLARKTAEQVQARKQAIPLEAMPAYERRIIHMALAQHPEVFTESSGAEPERRVVVLPK